MILFWKEVGIRSQILFNISCQISGSDKKAGNPGLFLLVCDISFSGSIFGNNTGSQLLEKLAKKFGM